MQRLKTRAQFQAVLGGKTVARTAHFVLHRTALAAPSLVQAPAAAMPSPSGPESFRPSALFSVDTVWLGAMVPKRWAKRAVTRNAIKRQIYQVSQNFAVQLPMAAHVVRLRSTFDRKVFISATSEPLKLAVRTELELLFARALAPTGAGAPA